MLSQYKTVYIGGEAEIIEKKSRFIATVRPVKSEEEALAFIEAMKKKYWNATHNCSAYVMTFYSSLQRPLLTFKKVPKERLFLRVNKCGGVFMIDKNQTKA